MGKKITIEFNDGAWMSLIGVVNDYIFLARTIIEQNEQQQIKASEEQIEDLEANVATAGRLLDKLMGEPITKELH